MCVAAAQQPSTRFFNACRKWIIYGVVCVWELRKNAKWEIKRVDRCCVDAILTTVIESDR